MKMSLILITFLACLLVISCSAEIGNDGGGNQDNDNYDIRIDYDSDGDNDSDDDKFLECNSCITDLAEELECTCLQEAGCTEEDIDPAYSGAVLACETPIVLGDEIIGDEFDLESGFGEGAI
jgi:hypothetical protein